MLMLNLINSSIALIIDFNRRTLVNVKSGALISFDNRQDMLNFKFNCEHLGHYNSWIITLHEQKNQLEEQSTTRKTISGITI